MADYTIIEEALKRGYTMDEIADNLARDSGVDPADARGRGYTTGEMMKNLGYVKPETSDVARGFVTSFKQLPQLGYGLLAGAGAVAESVAGEGGVSTSMKNFGVKKYQEAGADIEKDSKQSDSLSYSWEQAKQGDFGSLVDWLQYGIGYGGGQAVQALATAGVGSLVGKTVLKGTAENLASKMVAKEALRLGATEEAKRLTAQEISKIAVANVASNIGQTVAIGSQAFGMEGGEIFGDLAQKTVKEGRAATGGELAKAFGATAAAGALEFVGDKLGVDVMLGKSKMFKPASSMTGVGGRAARAAVAVPGTVLAEGGTEYLQTGIEEYGKGNEKNFLPFMQSESAQKQALDAAGLGAVGGGGMAMVGGAFSSPQKKDTAPSPASSISTAPTADDAINAFESEVETALPAPRGSFGGMDDLAGLIESERSDLGKRRGLLAQQQQEARDMEAEFSELVKDEQIDQSYRLNDAQKQRDAERTRDGSYDLALQQREEQQGRTVEQLSAASEAQGFGEQEPTAMQLAMQRAQQKALDNEFSGLLKQERANLNEMRANVKRVAGVPVEQISTPQLEEIAQSEAHPNTKMAAVAALNDRHDAIQQERERLMQLRETRLEKQSNQPEQGAQHGAESHGTDGQVATPSVAGGGANVSGGGLDAAMVAADRGMRGTASAGAAVSSGGQVGAVPVADQPANVRALTENAAKRQATQLTNQGYPTVAYPHPTQAGMWAIGSQDEAKAATVPATSATQNDAPPGQSASWVIRNKETGEVVMETFDRKKVDALNTAKYEAVPIREYLEGLNNRNESTAAEPPAVEVRAPVQRKRPASNNIAQAIINLGGISTSLKQDITGDASVRSRPGLFTKNGTADLGELAARLSSEFGFSQIDLNDPTDNSGEKQLADLIARAVNGESILNEEAMLRAQQDEEFEQAKAEVNLQAQEIGIKPIRGKRTIDIVQSEINAILAEREEMSRQKKKAQLLLDEVAEQELIEAFDLAMQEYHDETAISRDESRVESARISTEESAQGDGDSVDQASPVAGRASPTEGGRGEAEVTPEFGLVGQTEEEAIAEEQARRDVGHHNLHSIHAVLLRAVESIIPDMQRFERVLGKSQWAGYAKKLINSNDVLKGFLSQTVVGDEAKFKIALAKAADSKALESIADRLRRAMPQPEAKEIGDFGEKIGAAREGQGAEVAPEFGLVGQTEAEAISEQERLNQPEGLTKEQIDREAAAPFSLDGGGRQKESRGNAESESGRQANNPVSSKGVADKTAPANAGVSVSAPSESVRRIQAVVERFKSQFKGTSALDIRVVSTTFDIPARFRPSPFAEGVFHDDAGLVYLVTMNLHNPRGELSENRAWQVLLHESVGHYGLSQMMGDKFASILKAVKQATSTKGRVTDETRDTFQPGDKDYATWDAVKLRYPDASDSELAQEVLARMSETDPGSSVLGYAVATVRQWVRDVARAMGVNVMVSTSELRDLVAKASGYMRRGDNLAEEHEPSGLVAASTGVAREGGKRGLESRAATVQPQGPIWSAPEMSRTDNIIYTMQDKNIDLKRVQQAIKSTAGEIRDDIDAYLQEELFHGRAAKITEEFLDKEVNPLISLMRASNVSMEEMETFLWARHAKERNAQIAKINDEMPDGGSGLTNKQADDLMSGKDVTIGDKTIAGVKPARKKLLSDLAGRVDAITKGNRALLERYGLESAETLNAWDGAYQHYVPLHREDTDSHLAGMGTGQGYSVKGSSSKRATGSFRPVENILANLALQRERIITRGEKNRVAQALHGLAKEMPNADLWEVDVKPTMRTTAMIGGREQVVDAVDPNFRNKPNVVFARFNGEDRFVVFNEHNERALRMAEALKNLDADDISHLLGEVSRWTRYFASINTQYNPIFGVMNLVRDVQTGLLNLKSTPLDGKQKEMAGNLAHALPAVFKALRADRKGQAATGTWAQLWEEFQEVGGQTGYRDMFRNSHERAEALQNALDPTWWQKTWWGKAATVGGIFAAPEQVFVEKVGKPFMELLSDYNTMMENGIRLSAYKLALDSGMTKERAASLAKNLTVNFNRKGQAGRQVGAMYAFFNASVQGTARMAETLNHGAKPGELLGKAGKQIIYGGLMLGALQAMLLLAAGFDDEEPPEFVRDRNIIIPTGNGKYISIPLPLGFHVLPTIGRISVEFTAGGFKKPGEHLVHVMDVLLDSFNPIGNAGMSMQTLAPTVLDPVAALTENKDWSGRQIARQDFSKLNPTPGYTRAKDTASSLSRGLAYALNYLSGGGEYGIGIVSPTPDQIEYLIGQVTGGVGRELGKVATTGEAIGTGEDLPPHKIPLVGRFYGDTTGQSSEASKFYGTLEKLSEHKGALDRMKDAHDVEAYREYAKEHPEIRLYASAARVQREMASLRKLKRKMIERNADRAKVRQIEDRMRTLMTRFNQSVSEQKGDH